MPSPSVKLSEQERFNSLMNGFKAVCARHYNSPHYETLSKWVSAMLTTCDINSIPLPEVNLDGATAGTIQDPAVTQSKGRPKGGGRIRSAVEGATTSSTKRRRCGTCREEGHTRSKCSAVAHRARLSLM